MRIKNPRVRHIFELDSGRSLPVCRQPRFVQNGVDWLPLCKICVKVYRRKIHGERRVLNPDDVRDWGT